MSTLFGFPVVQTEARLITEEQRQVLLKVWAALRGIGMGASLDIDYARELADAIKPLIEEKKKIEITRSRLP